MTELSVGVRELKAHLSRYLQQVKAGATIIVTEHGRPVGRIMPVAASLDERMSAALESGVIAWNGQKLPPLPPMAPVKLAQGTKTVAELLIEDRE